MFLICSFIEILNFSPIDEIVSTDNKRIDNNIYWIIKEIDVMQSRNIYELAHECKEWTKYRGYYIHSSVDDSSLGHLEFTPTANIQCSRTGYLNIDSFMAKTEPEAIFEAAEYILNNLKRN